MDNYKTPIGEIMVGVLGHASLFMQWNGKNIYCDPYSDVMDFTGMAQADLILITHNHYDHYDRKAWSKIAGPETVFVVSRDVADKNNRFVRLRNNESHVWEGLQIDSVPSYNINRRNDKGDLFHHRGDGNGYVLDLGGFKIYIAGDTEPIPEMKFLPELEIAFLPKNLPYTMTDDEFIETANYLKPRYLYPIHFFEINIPALARRLDTGITLIDPTKS